MATLEDTSNEEPEPARLVRDLRAHQAELETQNRELREAQSQARRAIQEREDLLAVVSHDLETRSASSS